MKHQVIRRGWRYPRVSTGAIATWIATILLAPPSDAGWTADVNGVAVVVLVIVVSVNVWCWFKDRRMAR